MGRGKRRANDAANVALLLMTALIATALLDVAVATEFTVGNATGWDFAPTSTYYDDWASGLKFVTGDKLVFKYLPSAHNVQEVNETDYTTCNSLNPIAEYESGNDVVTLTKPGTHFYICGFLGHCDQGGMRMKTTTIEQVSTTPLIPVVPPTSNPSLPSPMTSVIPQLPPAGNGTTPHAPHGGHGAHPPVNAPITVPGHSGGDSVHVPGFLVGIMMSSGVAAGALFW